MAKIHWSKIGLNVVFVEAAYLDGARQTWEYDCAQYESLDALKANMQEDFTQPRLDRSEVTLHYRYQDNFYSVDLGPTEVTGRAFVNLVFDEIDADIIEETT